MAKRREQDSGPDSSDIADDAAKPQTPHRRAVLTLCVIAVLFASVAVTVVALRPTDAVSAMNSGHYAIARELLEPAARAGDAQAQNTLANLYYLGLGGAADQRAAAAWYLEAALLGNTDAQINVARHYVLGLGIEKDVVRAFAWLYHARSAGREVAEGQMRLLTGSVQITPNHVGLARDLYPTVESLRPTADTE